MLTLAYRSFLASPFRDASDMPEASYRPDLTGLDGLEDRLMEIAARAVVNLPAGIARTAFNGIVVNVCVAVLDEASRDGTLRELFSAGPTKSDLEMMTRILAELMDSDDPGLQAECLSFVLGLNVGGGRSETEIARARGVNKATVSKRCILIREAFGLPASRGMKTDAARASYSARQKGKRARPARVEWAYAGLLRDIYAH